MTDELKPAAAHDRRSLKTRTALHQAFLALVLARGYDGLQVSDISAAANVGRSTFYEHYRSKGDLLRASIAGPFGHLADLVAPVASLQPIIAVLHHFREQRHIARAMLGAPTRALLSQALSALVAARLHGAGAGVPSAAMQINARMIADAQLALLDIWILGRPACSVEAAADALGRGSRALAAARGAP